MPAKTKQRAIGIVRVSVVKQRGKTKGREESFVSPSDQRKRIEADCAQQGSRLLRVEEDELDVSGGTPLANRTGLLNAVKAIEEGKADVVVTAYFDRLVRSMKVQTELIERVEKAGGRVRTVDVGEVSEATAGQWLTSTMHGMMSEYTRRIGKERSGFAQRDAVERGVAPWPNIAPGYRRGKDGVLVIEPIEAAIVVETFKMRGAGTTIEECRQYLHLHGIERTWAGTRSMLTARVFLGEIHFGKLTPNLHAHDPIIDPDVWARAQSTVIRGPRPKSDRLLARLGVLRCASCGGRMSIAQQTKKGRAGQRFYMYVCRPTSDCASRASISADMIEQEIVRCVRERIADRRGRASAERNVRKVEARLVTAQTALDGAVMALDGLTDEPAVREKLLALRDTRDAAQADVDRLGDVNLGDRVLAGAAEWDKMSLDGQRALIARLVERATVARGRGLERVAVAMR